MFPCAVRVSVLIFLPHSLINVMPLARQIYFRQCANDVILFESYVTVTGINRRTFVP